jgi:chromosome segregation ATPase
MRSTALKQNIAEVDTKLEALRPRLTALRAELEKLIEKENRHVRLFAEADQREKKKIDQLLVEIIEKRGSLERECKGLSISVAELEESRRTLFTELEPLLIAEQLRERKDKIEALRKELERDQEAEREADKALMAARAKSNRSFYNWRAATDQLTLDEQAAALAKQKEAWAARSGPNARNPRQAS